MENYREQLNEILSFFVKEREKYSIELGECPEGRLGLSKSSRQKEFLWRLDGKRKGIDRKPEMIRKLARKEFLRKLLNEIDANISVISRAIQDYRDINPKSIIDSMTKAYAELSAEYFFSEEKTASSIFATEDEKMRARLDAHREWAEQPYEKNPLPFGKYEQWTSRGLHVRSQREQTICEMLYRYELPFRYDQIIHIGNERVAPDFTFQQYTGEELYLEYCGMMDDRDYVMKHLRKRRLYEQAGICEWSNMIYIYSRGRRFNTQLVDSIIRYQILPRM